MKAIGDEKPVEAFAVLIRATQNDFLTNPFGSGAQAHIRHTKQFGVRMSEDFGNNCH